VRTSKRITCRCSFSSKERRAGKRHKETEDKKEGERRR